MDEYIPGETQSAILEVKHISKCFRMTQALDDVSLTLYPGEVHALLGENGAGKSTLIKIIAGVHQPDEGQLLLQGQPVEITCPRQATDLGISVIYQELSLYPDLSVAENIFMGHPPRGQLGAVDWPVMYRQAEKIFASLGIEMDVRCKVSRLSVGNRQRVEIAKALSLNAKVLIMDEPTAALTAHDVESLFAIVRRLQKQGVGIIYISHRLEEIFELADRVSVLRDGKYVGTVKVADTTSDHLIGMMVGRTLDQLFPKISVPIGEPILELRNVTRQGVIEDISLTLRRGEILGLSGLVGSGRSDLAHTIFGIHPAEQGEIYIDGERVTLDNPQQAMKLGIAYVTEDRQKDGLVLPMTVKENISLATLAGLTQYGFVRLKQEEEVADQYVNWLNIRTPSIFQEVKNLSGGNQQKVVISKWLLSHPRILILDEPTRGIDVGAKAEIHRLMGELAGQGMAILMISSELPEILGMSDRILVMKQGRLVGEFDRNEATQEKIMVRAVSEQYSTV